MTRRIISPIARIWVLSLGVVAGCTSVSVDPQCPSQLDIGESGSVWANAKDPGAVPTYKWEAVPSDAGTFADPAKPDTSFTATKAGEMIIRLTAADGLFQAMGECRVTIGTPADVTVLLTADPNPVVIGKSVALFCASVGEDEAVTRTLEQLEGTTVTLDLLSEGVATFVPAEAGDLTFRCVGATEAGGQSRPSDVTVSVTEAPVDNDNGNANDNTNDNGSDNENGNDNSRPPRDRTDRG